MNSFWPRFKENPLMTVLLALVFLILILFLGIRAVNAVKEGAQIGRMPSDRDTITIQGQGKVSGKPTLALVDLGLFSEGKEVKAVQDQNSTKVNSIIAAMKEIGIAESDIQTANYSISPKFDYKDGGSTLVGYIVSQSVSVKVRDLTKVSTVLSRAGQLGLNQVNGVQFTIDDPSELQQQARKKALQDARNKAQELADALGVDLARVVTFAESSNNMPPIAYGKSYNEALGVGMGGGAAPDIQAGSLDVFSHVSVTFEIR
jgi:uncharacterized protein